MSRPRPSWPRPTHAGPPEQDLFEPCAEAPTAANDDTAAAPAGRSESAPCITGAANESPAAMGAAPPREARTARVGEVCAPGAAQTSQAERPTNLAQVRAVMEAAYAPPSRRRERLSALNAVSRVLDRELKNIPADPALLRGLLADANPMRVRMGNKRWSAVKTLVRSTLREVGFEVMAARDTRGLSPAWAPLAVQLDRRLRAGLSRFMSYCSGRGVAPENVDHETFGSFHTTLRNASLQTTADRVHRQTLRYWNQAHRTVAGWPRREAPVPADPRRYALEPARFAAAFQVDVEACLAQASQSDPFAADYFRALRPATRRGWRIRLYQVASALVASGFPLEELRSLAVLVEPANAEAALRYLRRRHGDKNIPQLAGQAATLCSVARRWVGVSKADLARLRGFAANLRPRQSGMTAKNRERLRQFDVPANLDALLALPDRAFCETEKGGAAGPQEALHMMLAVAVELLTVTTLRMKNLAALDIDRHLIKVRRNGQVEYRIVIPAAEMKTDAPFEMTVPQMSLPLLAAYLNTHRRRLATDPGPHLFPGRKGARSPSALGRAISAFIKRETGLTMHPHLFRALGTRIHLERRPHAIEEMRRVLGHRSSATTIEAYTDFSTAQAFREYDETIARRRRDGDSRRAPTARKKPRK